MRLYNSDAARVNAPSQLDTLAAPISHQSAVARQHAQRVAAANAQAVTQAQQVANALGELLKGAKGIENICSDIAHNENAGKLLERIIYWHSNDERGRVRLRIADDGRMWIAREYDDWWLECRLSFKKAKTALAILKKLGLVLTKNKRFDGDKVVHISLNLDRLKVLWAHAVEYPNLDGTYSLCSKPKKDDSKSLLRIQKNAQKELLRKSKKDSPLTAPTSISTSKSKQQTRETQISPEPVAVDFSNSNDGSSQRSLKRFEPPSNPFEPLRSDETSKAQSTLMAQMLEIGVDAKVAAQLESTTDAKVLCLQLDCLSDRNPKDPAATFISSVKRGWSIPPSYATRVEKAKNDARERAHGQEMAKRAHEKKATEREKEVRSEQENAALDAMFAGLNEATRQRLENEARSTLLPFMQRPAAIQAACRNLLRESLGQIEK